MKNVELFALAQAPKAQHFSNFKIQLAMRQQLISIILILGANFIFAQSSNNQFFLAKNYTTSYKMVLVTIFILAILFAFFCIWKIGQPRRRLRKDRKRLLLINAIKKNLETQPLYKAAPPRVPGGVRLDVALQYLSGVAKVDISKVLWFIPVRVKFFREVQIFCGQNISFSAQTKNEEGSIYYFGQTKEGLVLFDSQSGNYITGLYGRPLNFGEDFLVIKKEKLPEVIYYQAFEFFSQKFAEKHPDQFKLNL